MTRQDVGLLLAALLITLVAVGIGVASWEAL